MKNVVLLFLLVNTLIVNAQVDYSKCWVSTKSHVFERNNDTNKFDWNDSRSDDRTTMIWPSKSSVSFSISYNPSSKKTEWSEWAEYDWEYDSSEFGEEIYILTNSLDLIVFSYSQQFIQIWYNWDPENEQYESMQELSEISIVDKRKEEHRKEYIPQTKRKK